MKEIKRLIAAFGHASDGLEAAICHPAFLTEILACMALIPLALLLGNTPGQRAMMIGSLFLVLIVELLNTGIESAIDRISTDIHPLSKRAKDMGSAAVLLSIVNAAVIWAMFLFGK